MNSASISGFLININYSNIEKQVSPEKHILVFTGLVSFGKDKSLFIKCKCFGATARFVSQNLSGFNVGDKIRDKLFFAQGALAQDVYSAKDGTEKREDISLIANSVEIFDKPSKKEKDEDGFDFDF